jgi:hypothetical protein
MAEALLSLGRALLLTVAVEAPAAWLCGLRSWRGQGVLLLVNIITNPTLNLILAALELTGAHAVRSPFDPALMALECVVVIAEALMLKAALTLPPKKAFLIALAANAASYLAGVVALW